MLAISLKRLGPVVYCFVSVRGGGARALVRPVTVTEGPQKIFFLKPISQSKTHDI
jgi:hypothetical protein